MGVNQLEFQRQDAELERVQCVGALTLVVTRHKLLDGGLFPQINVQDLLEEPLDLPLHGVKIAGDVGQVLPGQKVDQIRAVRVCRLIETLQPVQAKLVEIDVGLRQLVQSGENDGRVLRIPGLIEPQDRLLHILDHGLILPDIQTQQPQKTFRKREVFFCQR